MNHLHTNPHGPRPARERRGSLAGVAMTAMTAVTALLAACANPSGIAPHASMLEAHAVGLMGAPDASSVAATPPLALSSTWWQGYGDRQLDDLVERALAQHPSLRLAAARLAQAQADSRGADADRGPRLDAGVDVTRQRYTENGLYPAPLAGSTRGSGNVQATLNWELDFFGRHAAAIAEAAGTERAAQADSAAARLTLSSRVVQTYVQLARLVAQREVARRTLAQRDELLGLTRQRVSAGLDTSVELRQGEGSIPEARLQIAALDEQIVLARHALAALTAQPPSALDGLTPNLSTVQAFAPPTALPADLLSHRPDLAAARWRVEAALRGVDLSRVDFYPSVDLSAFAGLNAIGLGDLLESGSRFYGVGPSLRLPIFENGRLRARLAARSAQADAAVESYNETLLEAVRDAADGIASLRAVQVQQQEQSAARTAAEQAYDLALQRYRAGIGSYLVVLSAESSVLAQRRASVDLQARALDAQAQLARALGGGYTTTPPATSPTATSATPTTTPMAEATGADTLHTDTPARLASAHPGDAHVRL